MLTCSLARLKEICTIPTHASHTWLMCVCTHVCTHCPLQESVLVFLSPSLSVSSSFPVPFPVFLKKSSPPPSLCLPFCSICLSFGFLCVWFFKYLFVCPCWVLVVVCGIFDFCCGTWELVPQPGIKPGSPALGV